jgi:membrane protease YdiL (CAAX protease family)
MIIESSSQDLEACREQLAQGPHAKDIDVILYGVETSWDEEKTAAAQALIAQSGNWTREQRATLFELLTNKFQWKDPELASQYAMQAVSLKPDSRVLITAVERWIQFGAKDKARKLLVEAPASTWEMVPRFSAAKLLVDLGDPKAAAALLRGEKSDPDNPNIMLARILAETGEIKAARELYRAAARQKYVGYDDRVEYFEFERRHGGRADAIAAYDQLRGEGFGADILSRSRLSLLLAYPSAPWHWLDVAGWLLLLALLLIFAAAPLLTIAPIHYRGLARRVAGLPPNKPATAWGLRHSWYALGVVWVAGVISLYVFWPGALEMLLPWSKRLQSSVTDIELGNELLLATIVGLLLAVPLLRGRSVRTILLGRWSVLKSVFVGIGCAIALKLVAALVNVGLQSVGALGSDTTRAMQGAHQSYGLAGMLLMVAVAVPFLEELVFRGVMLEAFRGQVTFWFATMMQAATFAAIHESPSDMPFLFAFGLLAGWLAKRSEGLLAPMAMHSAFNATSALAVIGITSVLNR